MYGLAAELNRQLDAVSLWLHPYSNAEVMLTLQHTRATGNSRSGSQKFPPPFSVKIPENSRYENTLIHPVCKRKFINIVVYLPITN